jgi:hypothetical protein
MANTEIKHVKAIFKIYEFVVFELEELDEDEVELVLFANIVPPPIKVGAAGTEASYPVGFEVSLLVPIVKLQIV